MSEPCEAKALGYFGSLHALEQVRDAYISHGICPFGEAEIFVGATFKDRYNLASESIGKNFPRQRALVGHIERGARINLIYQPLHEITTVPEGWREVINP